MKLPVDKAKVIRDEEGRWIAFRTKSWWQAQQLSEEVVDGFEVEAKKASTSKTRNANNYFWKLCSLLSDKLGTTKEELYLLYVKQVGTFKDFHLTPDEAKTFEVAWSKIGTGWPTERVDFDEDGEKVVVRAYYGASTYDRKRMGRLIDMVVADCEEQGIETATPDEIALMKERWKDER